MVQGKVCLQVTMIFLFFGPALHQVKGASSQVHLNLLGDLLDKYTKPFMRPVNETTRPVEVGLRFTPIFSTLDETKEELQVRGMFALKWTDFRLRWEPADYDGINETTIPLSVEDEQKVWIPEVFVYECLVTEFQSLFTETKSVTLIYTGEIHWYTLATTKTYCTVQNRRFPFDVQICSLTFTTWLYQSNEQIFYAIDDLVKSDAYKMYEIENELWSVQLRHDVDVGMKTYDCESCNGEKQSYLRYKLELTRGQSFLLASIFVFPCIVIAILTTCVTCLPGKVDVDAPIYSLTCVLTLFVYLTFLYTRLPPTGAAFLEIIIICMVLGGVIAVIWAVCTVRNPHIDVKSRTSDGKKQGSINEGAALETSSDDGKESEGENREKNVGTGGARKEQPTEGRDKPQPMTDRHNEAHSVKDEILWQFKSYNMKTKILGVSLIIWQILLISAIIFYYIIVASTKPRDNTHQ